MVTLLSVGNSEGERRCDARCHQATEPDCDCVCGGRYHGKGLAQAREQMSQDLQNGRFGEEIRVAVEALREQLTLPLGETP
ncbi:MAG TPA: hypothetical protein VG276_28095 [Actinomycetes bacterium]|jgi:hypothetical protein|nr:hypothetical protein [Actinomycetes bacterium]